MAESQPVESTKRAGDKPRKVGHIKMLVIADLKAATIDAKVSTHVDNGAQITSDHSTSYHQLEAFGSGALTSSQPQKGGGSAFAVGAYRHQQCQKDAAECFPRP
jgi:hypothetical protein